MQAASVPVVSNSVSALSCLPLGIEDWEACCEAASARYAAFTLPNLMNHKAFQELLTRLAEFKQHE